jgi:hypothetical protein
MPETVSAYGIHHKLIGGSMMYRLIFVLVISPLLLTACFPTTEVTMLEKEALKTAEGSNVASKAHVIDASVILFPDGCRIEGNSLNGIGTRHWVDHEDLQSIPRSISLDSVAAVTYYEKHLSAGRVFAEGLFTVTAPFMTFLGVVCIINPKSCFGSCPTVYTYEASSEVLEAELFSSSISKLMEESDLDVIGARPDADGAFMLRVTNEALETHYINQFQLLSLEHPTGTRVFPGPENSFVIVKDLHEPLVATSRGGVNVLPAIKAADDTQYRTGDDAFERLTSENENDWVDLSVNVPEGTTSVKMVLRLRNSLLSTILFYDLVLGSQGLQAINWTQRINEDPVYAELFRTVYQTFSGVKVLSNENGSWIQHASITDAGPINWKHVAVEIPVTEPGELPVRLQFFPDNIFIDYVGFDTSSPSDTKLVPIPIDPVVVINNEGEERSDVLPFISSIDDQRLITNPGDSYRFMYEIPRKGSTERTLFIQSHGYYTEWVRGGWLQTDASAYRFNLYDTQSTLAELTTRWLAGRTVIEESFFNSRIPVREEK